MDEEWFKTCTELKNGIHKSCAKTMSLLSATHTNRLMHNREEWEREELWRGVEKEVWCIRKKDESFDYGLWS